MRVYEDACCKQGINFLKLKYRIRATATTREERMSGYQGSHSADWSGYADDLELFFVSVEDLQKGLVLLHEIFTKFGLSINIKKTKTMIFNFELIKEHYDNMCYPESIVELDNIAIENVITFRYLGDEIKHDEPSTGDAEMNLRISLAQAKFYEIIKNLTNHKIYLKTRVLVFNSLVRSRLTYSCQTWNANQTQMNKINSIYIGMLRKLVWNGSKTENFKYVITNEEIIEICHTEDIHKFVERQQSSYLAHLARQSNSCLTKRLLFNDDKQTKIGRPIETLEDKVIKAAQVSKDAFYKSALSRRGHDPSRQKDRHQLSRR